MTSLASPTSPAFPDLFRDDALHLESRRLWLRWPILADAPRLHEIASLEAVARQTASWPHPLPAGEAERRIEKARAANAAGTDLVLAIAEKTRPRGLIGLIGVGTEPDGDADTLTLGYMLDVERQGYGLMTEAARTLVTAVFRYSQTERIRGSAGVTNLASRRVMEKAGFRLVGQRLHPAPARAEPVSCDDLELTRKMWRGSSCVRVVAPGDSGIGDVARAHAA